MKYLCIKFVVIESASFVIYIQSCKCEQTKIDERAHVFTWGCANSEK